MVNEALAPYADFMSEEEKQAKIDEAVTQALEENYEKTVKEVLPDAIDEALKSKEYLDEKEKARTEAYEEAEDEINEEFDKQDAKKSKATLEAEKNFKATPVVLYENFYKDVTEDNDLDGNSDGKVRIYAYEDYALLPGVGHARDEGVPDHAAGEASENIPYGERVTRAELVPAEHGVDRVVHDVRADDRKERELAAEDVPAAEDRAQCK